MNLSLVIKAVQEKLALEPDGLAGPATWRAIHLAVVGKPYAEFTVDIPNGGVAVKAADLIDERSEKILTTLLPEVRPYARALVHAAADQGINIKITSGTRTYAEQDALYAQGRTAPGKIVTNAKGGQSNHNFGIAFDIGIFSGTTYVPESKLYSAVGILGRTLGLEWGGDWTSITDEPHFQFNPKHYTLAQLRDRKAAGLSPV